MKRSYKIVDEDQEYTVELEEGQQGYTLRLGEDSHHFELLTQSATLYSFLIDGSEVLEADMAFSQDRCELNLQNVPYHLEVFDPRRRIISQSELAGGSGLMSAPMPGKIVAVNVAVGARVEKGQSLIVIEAMKMQNELQAAMSGVVAEVTVAAGATVEADQKLLLIKKAE